MSQPSHSKRVPRRQIAANLQARMDELEAQRDTAVRERDELRGAAPDADAAYWQDRCLDHATALDTCRAERDRYHEALTDALGYLGHDDYVAARATIEAALEEGGPGET